MVTLVAQIAPQRSTQYAALAETLAPHELRLSLGDNVGEVMEVRLGGQDYLRFDLPEQLTQDQAHNLGTLATIRAFFAYHERIGGHEGPFLQPVEALAEPVLPPTLLAARRYRGKTNELFTQFLCNVARFSSDVSSHPWPSLRVFDPLAGGGTTLFAAMMWGASAAGVEHNTKDVESTAAFVRRFMREAGIAYKEKAERFKQIGRRWVFTIGKQLVQQCIVAIGDTADSPTLISGFRPHLIVTDLPYGIQHRGELAALLEKALPIWTSLLPLSGALAMAWESKRFPRAEMIELVQSSAPLLVLNHPPYDLLAHRVDRVIKERDVIVARLAEALRKESN
jgi:hypothetical protein